ncbi:immunoglobulin-like domain-containing protein [Tenacibaculum aiptasiae]|uniref:immunoglobulin-like domain-containing protein n=1 Tax=Tenacibaculum aiptasiae TaxID=426481 RepID=UPI003B5CAD80
MKQLIKNVKVLSIFILIITFIGCEENDATLPKVTSGFTYTVNQDLGKVTFINISENADNYEWDFGDGTTSTEINPTKIYPTGEYTVVLKSTNVSGASETFEDKVYINIPIPVRLPINFDTANVKYDEITLFPTGGTFKLVENPDPSGSNATSSMVAELTNNGVNWEGFFYDLDAPIDFTTNKTIVMDLWSNVQVPVLLKLEQGSSADIEITVTHGGTGWEQLIFTFDSDAKYNRLTLFVDGPGTTAGKFYIDNIEQVPTIDVTPPTITLNGDASMSVIQGTTFTDPGATATDNVDGDISGNIMVGGDTVDTSALGTYTITYNVSDVAGNAAAEVTRTVEVVSAPTAPTNPAPTPPAREAGDVISIFSDAYADVTLNELPTSWSATSFEATTVGSDNVWKLSNLDFLGIVTNYATGIDVSSMEKLHIDYWVPSGVTNELLVKIVNTIDGGEDIESLGTTVSGSWQSIDIDMSGFDGGNLANKEKITQILIDSDGIPSGDVFIDNFYFYKEASSGGGGSSGNVVSIYNNDFTDISVNEWGPFWGDSSARIVDGTLNGSPAKVINMEGGKTFAGIDFSSSAFDATSFTTFHIDYKVDVLLPGQVFNIKLSNHEGGSGETSAIQYTHVPTSTDVNSLSIPLADFVAASDPQNLIRNAIAQIVISAARADTTQGVNITIDNIYFSE